MKRYAFIAALILLIGTVGRTLAEKGPDGSDKPRAWQPRSEQQDATATAPEDDTDTEDAQDQNQEQDQEDTAKPEDVKGEEHKGFLERLFGRDQNSDQDQPQEDRKGFLDGLKQQRDDLQQQQELDNQKESRAALEAEIKAKRDAFKAEIEKVKKEKPTIRKEFVEARLTAAIASMYIIDGRISTKIDEFSGKSYDMTEAKKALDAAETSLKAAEDQFAILKATTVSDTSDTSVTKPREIAKKIEDLLKQTRDSFKQSVTEMKIALGISDDTTEATTTTTTTTPTSQQ